jgi:hypothetical protein
MEDQITYVETTMKKTKNSVTFGVPKNFKMLLESLMFSLMVLLDCKLLWKLIWDEKRKMLL